MLPESWDYVDKLKSLNDDQLWTEYSKVTKQLVEVSKPYTQRSRRKNEGDDNYMPVSPPYEQYQPNSKKRKKPAMGKNMKRKRQYGTGDDGGSKRKKRKTRDDTEVSRKYRGNARKKPHSFDDSDDDLSMKRKFGEDSDEDMSETSDFGRSVPIPQNEYSAWSLKDIVERHVKYTKQLEKMKIKKMYSEQLTDLMKEKNQLEHKHTTVADKLEHLQNTKDIAEKVYKENLEQKQKVFNTRLEEMKKRETKLIEMIHQKKVNDGSFGKMDSTFASENLALKTKISDQQAKIRELEMSARNGKVPHMDIQTKGLSDQLWVEQKYSKEMQAHYKDLVDLVSKVRHSDSASKTSEAQKAKIAELQSKLLQKELTINDQNQEINRLQKQWQQVTQNKGSAKRNRKNERKNKDKKPKPIIKPESLTAGLLPPATKEFKETDLKACLVCCETGGEMYTVRNSTYQSGQPTRWVRYNEGFGLLNASYRMYHKRCTRGKEHLLRVETLTSRR